MKQSGQHTFKNYLLSRGQSQKSIISYQNQLCYYLNWCEDQRIEAEGSSYNDLMAYVQYLQTKEIKAKTIQLYLQGLSHYFDWQLQLEKREDNPTKNINIKGVQRKRLYDILNRQELEQLYHQFKLPTEKTPQFEVRILTAKRDRCILGLMVWQGLDTNDLEKLQIKDLKLREGIVFVKGSRRTNERSLKLEATQILDLMEYSLTIREAILGGRTSELLFVSIGKTHQFKGSMQRLMKKLRTQFPRIKNIFQIRASVITYWLKKSNLREVQYKAGHRFVGSTEAFLVNDLDELQEDILKYHPF